MPTNTIELAQTRIGQPQIIGVHRSGPDKGKPFWSSIHRQPVPADSAELYLTWGGLAGDLPTQTRPKTAKEAKGGSPGQIHGGNDKAVYVYPWDEHYPHWLAELGEAGMGDRSLGENLRVRGAHEHNVQVGDVWSWGEAQVVVSKVRTPCENLEVYFDAGRWHMIKRMAANGRCGWYLRVVRPGIVPTSGHIVVQQRSIESPYISEAYEAKMRAAARK
jgi:MOSC domain-containing protein YiiM